MIDGLPRIDVGFVPTAASLTFRRCVDIKWLIIACFNMKVNIMTTPADLRVFHDEEKESTNLHLAGVMGYGLNLSIVKRSLCPVVGIIVLS